MEQIKRYWWMIAGAGAAVVFLILLQFRYEFVPNGYGAIYRVDHWTGATRQCNGGCEDGD